jgi:hypothetical protein
LSASVAATAGMLLLGNGHRRAIDVDAKVHHDDDD